MLAGHYAPALALKRRFPEVPLWQLFVAVQAVDIAFFMLALIGLEGANIEPEGIPRLVVTAGHYTHSLLMSAGYMLGAVALGYAFKRPRWGWALGLAIFSHWICDLLVHTPDLPLAFSHEPRYGFSLWLHPVWSCTLEMVLLIGAWFWARPSLPVPHRGRFDGLVVVMLVVQALSEFVVPTPPTIGQMAASAEALYLVLAMAAWRVEAARSF